MAEFTVMCAILGHKTVFSVKIKSDKPVSELKNEIRAMAFETLASFQVSVLKLYKVNIPVPDPSAEDTLIDSIYERTIEFNEGDELRHLTPELQDVFGESGPVRKNIHILVKVPEGESFSSRPSRDVADCVIADTSLHCNDSLIIHYCPVYPSLIVYRSLQSLPSRPTSTSTCPYPPTTRRSSIEPWRQLVERWHPQSPGNIWASDIPYRRSPSPPPALAG